MHHLRPDRLPIIAHLVAGASLAICDSDPARLGALRDEIAAGGLGDWDDVREFVDAAAAATLARDLEGSG